MEIKLSARSLKAGDAVTSFDCEESALTKFLHQEALEWQERKLGHTVVFFEPAMEQVIGYYTIAPASLEKKSLEKTKVAFKKGPQAIPGWIIGRLARHISYRGKRFQVPGVTLGDLMMNHAIQKCIELSEQGGGTILIVDCKNEHAKQFYRKFGFVELTSEPNRLVARVKHLAASLSPAEVYIHA